MLPACLLNSMGLLFFLSWFCYITAIIKQFVSHFCQETPSTYILIMNIVQFYITFCHVSVMSNLHFCQTLHILDHSYYQFLCYTILIPNFARTLMWIMCITIHMHLATHCSKMANGHLTVVLIAVLIFWQGTSSIWSRTVTTGYRQRRQSAVRSDTSQEDVQHVRHVGGPKWAGH